MLVNESDDVGWVNQAAIDLLNLKPDELRPPSNSFSAGMLRLRNSALNQAAIIKTATQLLQNPGFVTKEWIWTFSDRVLSVLTQPIYSSYFKGRIWLFNDVTELYYKNQQLADARLEIENLMSVIAHDLKSPLSTLGLIFNFLPRYGPVNPEQNETIDFVCLTLVGYLTLNVLYLFVSAVAGRLGRADDVPVTDTVDQLRRIAILIPAYKEDAVILGSVQANSQQDYPADRYDLIVIADSFLPKTFQSLSLYPVRVIPVEFEQSTVQKSIAYALNALPENTYDIVLISDADNHMEPDFLKRINQAFGQGWRAVQGHRTANNTNTSVAVFDAMNEEVNNTIFRAGQRALGLSATPIGSGMAYEPTMMKHALNQIQMVGGMIKN